MAELIISEVFGPTVQGEGPSTGRLAIFVRLGLCNLHCRWCDTPFTWDWSGRNGVVYSRDDLVRRTVDEVAADIAARDPLGVAIVVISGGEPMIQQHALAPLVEELLDRQGRTVEVETNATIKPEGEVWRRVRFNCSPKLADADAGGRPALLDAYAPLDSIVKFVLSHPKEISEALDMTDRAMITRDRVWLMPQGRHASEIGAGLHTLAELAITTGTNLSGRMHVSIWNDERGR